MPASAKHPAIKSSLITEGLGHSSSMSESKADTPTTATGLAVGRNKGHIVKKRSFAERPSRRKGRISKSRKLTREVVRSVAGMAPYERRISDLLMGGGVNAEKRARRYAKKRLGTLRRAKRKLEEVQNLMQAKK